MNLYKDPVKLLRYKKYNVDDNSIVNNVSELDVVTKKIEKVEQEETNSADRSFSIVWNKLKYEVNSSLTGDGRVIFDNLNGIAHSGEMLAILGPSGAGKTSLLNILMGKTRQQDYKGERYLVNRDDISMSFIPQQDHLNDLTTVEESLMISSEFKNTQSDFDHQATIEKIAKRLNLLDCLHTRCNLISGGEYKRTCIGQELIAEPDLLVLDEPTSGLDSFNSKKLLLCLKQLIKTSQRPISIILSIHQPGDELFHLFDRVYIMGRLGQVIYEGPPKCALSVVENHFISSKELLLNVKSIASFMLEIASNIHGQQIIDSLSEYQKGQFLQNKLKLLQTIDSSNDTNDENNKQLPKLVIRNKVQRDFWYTVKRLARRDLQLTFRDNLQLLTILLYYSSATLFVWMTFPKSTNNRTSCPIVLSDIPLASILSINNNNKQQSGTNNLASLLEDRAEELALVMENIKSQMILATSYGMACAAFSVFTLPTKIRVSLKEVTNGWYKYSALTIAIAFVTIIRDSLLPLMGSMITYVLCGQSSGGNLLFDWRTIMVSLFTAFFTLINSILGMVSGTIFVDSLAAAIGFILILYMPQLTLVQFVLRPSSMRPWLRHISVASLHRAAASLIATVRFGYNLCKCDQNLGAFLTQKNGTSIELHEMSRKVFDYALQPPTTNTTTTTTTTTTNSVMHDIGSSLAQFLNYGEIIKDCNDFDPYILKFTGIDQKQAATSLLIMVAWFAIVIVSMFVATTRLYKKRT